VELDTFHDDKPVQHREVMGHESRLFKGYFDDMRLMKGGYDTGFKRVSPENLPKRLFQIVRDDATRKTICKEIPMKQGNLNDCDVFIIDNGLEGLYQYNGKDSNMNEKYKAAAEVQKIESERSGKVSGTVIDGHSIGDGHPALKYFKQGKSKEKAAPVKGPPMMFKVSDEDGSLDAEEILNGSLNRELLNSKDVFIIDDGEEVFVWVGAEASVDENTSLLFSNSLFRLPFRISSASRLPSSSLTLNIIGGPFTGAAFSLLLPCLKYFSAGCPSPMLCPSMTVPLTLPLLSDSIFCTSAAALYFSFILLSLPLY
jgi:gelsolin